MKSNRCSVCFKEGDTEIHHIIPRSFGGPHIISNLIELCLSCHAKAHGHKEKWREKIKEGIARAKERGVYDGRKKSIDRDIVVNLYNEGVGATEISRRLGIGRSSVYRLVNEVNSKHE